MDITKVEKQSSSLSKHIYTAMDKQAVFKKKFDAAKKTLPADKVGKISTILKLAEDALDAMIQSTIKINESIENAKKRQETFEAAVKALKAGSLAGRIR